MGAPKANTTQHNVVEGGQVLRCNWDSNRNCQPIIFDSTGNKLFTWGERGALCALILWQHSRDSDGRGVSWWSVWMQWFWDWQQVKASFCCSSPLALRTVVCGRCWKPEQTQTHVFCFNLRNYFHFFSVLASSLKAFSNLLANKTLRGMTCP